MNPFNEEFLSTQGRINRKLFNLYVLFVILLALVVLIPCNIISSSVSEDVSFAVYLIGQGIVEAAMMPGLFLAVRRLHDLNHSGTQVLFSIFPIVNLFWLLYLMLVKGTKGANRYGQKPSQSGDKDLEDEQPGYWDTKYFSTQGRLNRKPLINYIAALVGSIAASLIITITVWVFFDLDVDSLQADFPNILYSLASLAFIDMMSFAVILLSILFVVLITIMSVSADFLFIRRLHDLNLSGWWLLLTKIIPFAIVPFAIALMLIKGKDGSNKYGENPLNPIERDEINSAEQH